MKIYNIGSLNIDYVYHVSQFVQPGETRSPESLDIFPGGKGLNQSVALARSGAQVTHGGAVGADGAFLVEILRAAGVDVSGIRMGEVTSGHAIIQVDPQGQNAILLFAGANHSLTEAQVEALLADAQPGDLLLAQNETNLLGTIFEIAHRKQLQIAFNPSPIQENLRSLPLEYVTWWFLNELEGAALTGKQDPEAMAEDLLSRYPHSRIILTLGSDGCIYRAQGACYRQSIFPVKAVDTTGAGDTFTGFFLGCVASGAEIPEALRLASAAAAIAVSRPGASASIPGIDEVITFANSR